jgi:hypothetical protein
VRRQREDWQRDATRHLATGRTVEALRAYDDHGHVHAAPTREGARADLIDRWDRDRLAEPNASRIILTHTNDEVRELNQLARDRLRTADQLGEDMEVRVARGERTFAAGDRVLFLRNERSLDVKNGTLGTVERINHHSLTVQLDSGRSVGFDLKDYADIDHGYAATLHKSQGVTIDRAHVLATPGLDRHAAYVALSRHRDRVDLHYGQDDFQDLSRLGRTLSRERAKDMALDHAGPETPERAFAARRGITFRERVVEVARKVRDIFADFKPAPREPVSFESDREGLRRQAIQRHARTVADIFRMGDQGLPALPHQTSALNKARTAPDAFDPHASGDLERAYKADRAIPAEVARGRTQQAIRTLQLEAELRADPALRAGRFVDDWTRMNSQRLAAYRTGDMAKMHTLRDAMGATAKTLERDPQVDSLLRNRRQALGVEADMGRKLSHDLAASVGLGVERSRGLGR